MKKDIKGIFLYQTLFSNFGLFFLATDEEGRILTISSRLKKLLGIENKLSSNHFYDFFLEQKTFDLFSTEKPDKKITVFKYRTFLVTKEEEKIPVEISSFIENQKSNNKKIIWFLIQQMPEALIQKQLDTGSFEDNIKSHQIANRYLSKNILDKAKNAVQKGLDYIPGQTDNYTLFFGDLASFTSFSENRSPKEIIKNLNRTIGAASAAITHWEGVIDKYIGDSIFAIFKTPLNAVIAAIEIQKMFKVFNEFRSVSHEQEIYIRIGINSGKCIQDTIGSSDNLNLTVIGDAVNIASRLEKASEAGKILISEFTALPIYTNLHIEKEVNLFLKGHKKSIKAYFIEGVKFKNKEGKDIEIFIEE